MLFELLLKGLLIGIMLGVPAGAIGALTIQRTIDSGLKGGFISGAGSCTADLIFAAIGVFGVSIISDFLIKNEAIIEIVGGLLIGILGVTIILKKKELKTNKTRKLEAKLDSKIESKFEDKPGGNYVIYYFSSFAAAILNPATMVAFMVAFTSFDLTDLDKMSNAVVLIISIVIGTFTWWVILCGLISIFRNKINNKTYRMINYVLGSLVLVFGLIIIIQGIMGVVRA